MGIPLGISLGKSLQLLRNENAVIVHPTCAIWAHLAHLIDQSDCKMTTSHTIKNNIIVDVFFYSLNTAWEAVDNNYRYLA